MAGDKKLSDCSPVELAGYAGVVSTATAWLTTPALMFGVFKGVLGAAMIGGAVVVSTLIGVFGGAVTVGGAAGAASRIFTKSQKIRDKAQQMGTFAGALVFGNLGAFTGYTTGHDIVVKGMEADQKPEARTETRATLPDSVRENFSQAVDRKTGATYDVPAELTLSPSAFKMNW